jgi:hypothetical protein
MLYLPFVIWPKHFFYKQSCSNRHQSSIPASLIFRWHPWSNVVYPFKARISYSKDLLPWNGCSSETIDWKPPYSWQSQRNICLAHWVIQRNQFWQPKKTHGVTLTLTSGYHGHHTWFSWQPHQVTMATTKVYPGNHNRLFWQQHDVTIATTPGYHGNCARLPW